MEDQHKVLTMLLLGDKSVGKSSLIMSLVTETFIQPDKIPARCEPITIPKDVTPEQVETLIIDWSDVENIFIPHKISTANSSIYKPDAAPEAVTDFEENLRTASVILLVYDATDSPIKIFNSISRWLDTIETTFNNISNSINQELLENLNSESEYADSSLKNSSGTQSMSGQHQQQIHLKIPPIILVGNKIDNFTESSKNEIGSNSKPETLSTFSDISSEQSTTSEDLTNKEFTDSREKISYISKKLMYNHSEIELCIECSAKNLVNISELFYQAQKAVLYPLQPLYKVSQRRLTKSAQRAVNRVFHLSDLDGDHHLDENELSELQRKAFNAPLPGQALDDLKKVVKSYDANSSLEWIEEKDILMKREREKVAYLNSGDMTHINTNQSNNLQTKLITGLTEKGFQILMQALIERGRQDTVWILLRTFGYDNELKMGRETGPFFLPTDMNLRDDDVTELSDDARHFLAVLFDRMDLDNDGVLNGSEQKTLFRPLPIPPWKRSKLNWQVECNDFSCVNLSGFLAWYDYKAFFEPRSVLCDLAYLGFPILSEHPLKSAIEVRSRNQPSQKVLMNKAKYRTPYGTPLASRRVFLVKIIGARYSGKTTLMQGLIGHDLDTCQNDINNLSKNEPSIVSAEIGLNGTNFVDEQEDYYVTLILNEVPCNHIINNHYNPDLISDADVIGLVYNPSEDSSYSESLELYSKIIRKASKNKYNFQPIPTILISSNRANEPEMVNHDKIHQDIIDLNNEKSKRQGHILYGPINYCPGKGQLDRNFFSIFAKMAVDPQLLYKGEVWQPIMPTNQNDDRFGVSPTRRAKANNHGSAKGKPLNTSLLNKNKSKSMNTISYYNNKNTIDEDVSREARSISKSVNNSLISLENIGPTAVVLAAAGIVTGILLSKNNS